MKRGRGDAALRLGSNAGGLPCELVACLAGMVLGVQLARLVAMMLRVEMVRMGDMGVVGGLFVEAARMRLGCGVMMPRGMFVMLGSVLVVLDLFLVGHVIVFNVLGLR